MRRSNLEGAACSELSTQVVDHLFEASQRTVAGRVMAQAAINICTHHCPVLDECRLSTLNGPLRRSGIQAGLTSQGIRDARDWQAYELGVRPNLPRGARPDWVPRSDASETVEQMLVEDDLGVDR